jgi:hypothetical protein
MTTHRPHHRYQEQTITYSSGSGSATKSDTTIDKMSGSFHVTEDHTDWLASDVPTETIERFGNDLNKWEWLNRLNRSESGNGFRGENRKLARSKDLRQLIDLTDLHDEKRREWLLDEALDVLESIHESEHGLRGRFRLEVMEIAMVTLAARRMVTRRVRSLDELDETDPLYSLAMDGEQVQTLRKEWVGPDAPDTREARERLRECLCRSVDDDDSE